MRRRFAIAALTLGALAISAVPAAAQGWYGPRGGFGISVGFGGPYADGYYAAPGAYAYVGPAGYGYGGPYAYEPAYAYGPAYAYEPDYTYGPSVVYQTYDTSPGYGFRGSSIGARTEYREGIRSRQVIRSSNFTNERGMVRTRARGQAFIGSNVRERGSTMRTGSTVRSDATMGRAMRARASANVRSNATFRSDSTVGRSGNARGAVSGISTATRSGTAGRGELRSGASVRGRGD